MKGISVLGAVALGLVALFSSCAKDSMQFQGKGFPQTVDMVYLYDAENPSNKPVDSTKMVDGNFLFKNEKLKTGVYFIALGENDRYMVDFADNKCEILYDQATKGVTVKGSKFDKFLNTYFSLRTANRTVLQQCKEELKQFPENQEEMTEEQKGQYKAVVERLYESSDKFVAGLKNLVFSNPAEPISFVFLHSLLNDVEDVDLPKMRELINAYSGPETTVVKRCKEFIQAKDAIAVGMKFTDFEVLKQDGERAKLSDVAGQGKVILVDFWASWCGYCKRAFPELKELYKEFAPKGFEIFGYSLDKDKSKWKAQLETDQLPWLQFVTDESIANKGENLYGVRSIPFTVLLDKDGTILGTSLTMDALRAKLAEKLQ